MGVARWLTLFVKASFVFVGYGIIFLDPSQNMPGIHRNTVAQQQVQFSQFSLELYCTPNETRTFGGLLCYARMSLSGTRLDSR